MRLAYEVRAALHHDTVAPLTRITAELRERITLHARARALPLARQDRVRAARARRVHPPADVARPAHGVDAPLPRARGARSPAFARVRRVLTQRPRQHVGVQADVVDVKTGAAQTTNDFRFTWVRPDGEPLARKVVPRTYRGAKRAHARVPRAHAGGTGRVDDVARGTARVGAEYAHRPAPGLRHAGRRQSARIDMDRYIDARRCLIYVEALARKASYCLGVNVFCSRA
jgi:hypothetical protein